MDLNKYPPEFLAMADRLYNAPAFADLYADYYANDPTIDDDYTVGELVASSLPASVECYGCRRIDLNMDIKEPDELAQFLVDVYGIFQGVPRSEIERLSRHPETESDCKMRHDYHYAIFNTNFPENFGWPDAEISCDDQDCACYYLSTHPEQ